MARLTMPFLVAAVVLALAAGAASQAPAPAPGADCSSAVTGLIGCITYVQQGSTQSKPSKDCCDGVKGALKSPATVACLCNAFSQNVGIMINFTRAAGLPAACGGDPTAFSKCNIKVPGAPTEGPAPSSGSGPAAGSPKSTATRSPISATVVIAAVAAPLLSYYYL
ncbi:non-specific lipid transfer protein-like 1 [Phragmites australis]|uniref:non-specific lipid transfer protein-like 1 n=1 Tax=Phragmites australis TaxID=29695 RepID=UPI002D77F4AD|nr:non-specific lipid transfer protein-like 1 [Phragmites australis]